MEPRPAFLRKLRQLQDADRQAEWQEIREAIHPTGTNSLQPLQYPLSSLIAAEPEIDDWVTMVVEQCDCSRATARTAIVKLQGDLVGAIMVAFLFTLTHLLILFFLSFCPCPLTTLC
jgi:hypothetical protein